MGNSDNRQKSPPKQSEILTISETNQKIVHRLCVTQTTFGSVWLPLSHSGVKDNFWAGVNVFISFRCLMVSRLTFGPVWLPLSNFCVKEHFWPGLPASISFRCRRVSRLTFGPDWLPLSHSVVEGSVGSLSKLISKKKVMAPMRFEPMPCWTPLAVSLWLFRPVTSRRKKSS
jgi:hypothetical protein